eukprot:scaffold110110_cov15-Tisochrysis_lutea.AAC.1
MGWWEGLAEVEPLLRCSQPPEKPHEDAPPGALVGSVGSVGVEAGEGGGCGAGAADLVPDDAAGGGSGVGVSACSSSLRAEAPSTDISITGGPALLPLLMLTRPEGCCSCCCCCGGDPEAVGFRGAGWEGGAAGAGGPAEVGAVVRAADGGWCVDGALLVAPVGYVPEKRVSHTYMNVHMSRVAADTHGVETLVKKGRGNKKRKSGI